ncbi:MAG: molybdenum cofactor cytidylyltransferase [Clostridiales bacterium]|jgi:molybdenum cofactor cytidylyltransferase|nr:molybdenum cofactor cytidylyltransferase [Clostridiales bacterium]MDN5281578.1 molybdenum cofactor cytidylyltransferase [Candidatus Ozemobacter sp.]
MISSICLLAGFSTRMGQRKQHVKLGELTFLEKIIHNLEANSDGIAQMFFVGQADDQKSKELIEKHSGIWLVNDEPERGPLSSIKIALEKIKNDSAIMLWPVDHPMISVETVSLLCRNFAENPDMIVVPSIDNRRGHPSIFPADLKTEFFAIPENEGARKILQLHPDRIKHVITDDIWVRKNINTPEILAEARKIIERI